MQLTILPRQLSQLHAAGRCAPLVNTSVCELVCNKNRQPAQWNGVSWP